MSIQHHTVEFESSFIEGGYTAHCDCGWLGKRWVSIVDAGDEWEKHLADTEEEASA